MKIVTWNINSIRVRMHRLEAWLQANQPDVLCLQETKTEDAGFPFDAIGKLGYQVVTSGQKSYNGVAILAKAALTDVARGFEDGEPEPEARVIAATVDGVRIVNTYVVNGQELGSDKFTYKLAWYGRLRAYLDRTATPTTPLVLCGDMNVTLGDLDVWSPDAWREQIHCSTPERDALDGVLAFGLTDLFRVKHPDAKVYSWWDYRGVAFFKDQGLRIDHVFGTAPILARTSDVTIDRTARKGQDASDHAPVTLTLTP